MAALRINAAAVGVYLFGLVIVYLAGMSLAGVLLYVFLLYLLFPLFSFLFLVNTILKFRYHENFSTEHPYKGEEVVYTLILANETILSGAFVNVKFKIVSPDSSMRLDSLSVVVKRGETKKESSVMKFPYRGIYKVGIDFIELFDVLRWFRFRPRVWFRTFYVYPRIVELEAVFSSLQNVVEASGQGQGIIDDHTLYRDLGEYRNGSSVKHIAWKKFAATGTLFVREYEKTSWPGVEIYLDLRRDREADRAVLEREDCSIEILTALMHYFLKNGIPAGVHAYNGRERYDFSGDGPAFFPEFYRSTIALTFAGDYSPADVYRADLRERLVKAGTVLIITHSFDPALTELVLGANRSELSVFVILNQSCLPPAEREENRTRLQALSATGNNIVFVDAIETIKENLET